MAWIRIDDHYDEHPKHAEAGPLGTIMWLAGLAYCNRNLTDGFIPWAVAQRLVCWEFLEAPDDQGRQKLIRITKSCGHIGDDIRPDYVIDLLLMAGLWEDTEGGYLVHDYDQYQPTREQVESMRNARVAGGIARANMGNARRNGRFAPAGTPAEQPASNQQVAGKSQDIAIHQQNNQLEHQQETSSNPKPNPGGTVPSVSKDTTGTGAGAPSTPVDNSGKNGDGPTYATCLADYIDRRRKAYPDAPRLTTTERSAWGGMLEQAFQNCGGPADCLTAIAAFFKTPDSYTIQHQADMRSFQGWVKGQRVKGNRVAGFVDMSRLINR
jgi:hypothetical protein